MTPYRAIISGDWLLGKTAMADCYRVGYEGIVIDHLSYGVQWLASREVAERVVADQRELVKANASADRLTFDGDLLIHTSPEDADFVRVIHPTPDDEYEMPGWTWDTVEASECEEVVHEGQGWYDLISTLEMLATFHTEDADAATTPIAPAAALWDAINLITTHAIEEGHPLASS